MSVAGGGDDRILKFPPSNQIQNHTSDGAAMRTQNSAILKSDEPRMETTMADYPGTVALGPGKAAAGRSGAGS